MIYNHICSHQPIGLVGFASSLPILAWPPHFQGVSSGRLTSWLFERQCCPRRCLFDKACTCRPGLPLHLEPSCAPISAGLLGLIECLWSPIMNCPCPSQSSDCFFISGWALTRCQLSRAGLQGQACRDIYVAAHFAPVGPWRRRRKFTTSTQPAKAYEWPWVMSGTAFLSVRVLMVTG